MLTLAGVPCGLFCGLLVGSANSSTTWLPRRDSYVWCLFRCDGTAEAREAVELPDEESVEVDVQEEMRRMRVWNMEGAGCE
jgi:hypothetical protein